MHGLGPKIHLKSPLAPQPVPLKLDSVPPSKGPFSSNIHPIIPKLSVPIPEGMCFRKMVRAPFENERLGAKNPLQITIKTPAGFLQTRLKFTFQRSFNFKRVCKKPAGVLMVIWSGFLAPKRSFSKGAPHHFPKAHAFRYGHRKFGNDRMYIRGEWALRRWHWIKFQWYRLGC